MATLKTATWFLLSVCACHIAAQTLHFSCNNNQSSATPLSAKTIYNDSKASKPFGFDLNRTPTNITDDACSSTKPFFFSIKAADGNYKVSLVLGGPAASSLTLRAESRRTLLLNQPIAAGASYRAVFTVHVRSPQIQSTEKTVKLKPREVGALDWDDKLTLEFNGDNPSVREIRIEPINNIPTLYLAGDSTVVDQDKEPWAAWGQMLPLFFNDKVSLSNQAESGETIHSFVSENRLEKIISTIRPGDFLFIQFAHNDQKPGKGYVSIPEYKDLLRSYIQQTQSKGATIVLVTSMQRRNFDEGGHITQTLGDYPRAMHDVAREEHIALIDLNVLSKTLFEAMGPEASLHAFVHYPANTFPSQPLPLKDDTHFNSYGAYELARCIIESIRTQHLPLARYIRPHTPIFRPEHPDAWENFHSPLSPLVSTETPYER